MALDAVAAVEEERSRPIALVWEVAAEMETLNQSVCLTYGAE